MIAKTVSRAGALALGLGAAAAFSQFPEFAQQYLQRLAGAVDQLSQQVAETESAAARLGLSRAAYLEDLSASRAGAQAAETARRAGARHDRLSGHLDAFREAGATRRLTLMPQVADRAILRGTFSDFQPALPLTAQGAGFAVFGLLLGLGCARLGRRAVRAATLRAGRADSVPEAATKVAIAQSSESEEEDVPFLEYEGDISAAMRRPLPPLKLAAQDGTIVDLAMLTAPAAIFLYPLMGRPGISFPDGWGEIDGADGATSLACSFRDAYAAIRAAGIGEVFGVSGQSPADQAEAAHRLALPFPLLSDPRLELAFALDLPRFVLHHERYLAPAVIVVQGGRVVAALYPVRAPETAATLLLQRLAEAREAQDTARTA